ncbi:LacI family DNA-binding transcriptional regulator [Microbacterium jejuense]|uniref:LacI family DNA-binding transcriptional regulator n=1 Tax=Microbacterium jejuense TaxID=1263637 RepID=A0ABS7HNV9_9MICO|nr:LacI family DNA-binding transcriptional regulator [Microbacterium jejuense]MBW9094110.1 LacI family DNA-binding transcriptional regulator [Microbacterium jejuense]
MARKASGSATIRDVAQVAGVSIKTVSNVLNGYPYIRPETRESVEKAIRDLDYHVNVSARNLSRGRTGVIALVLPAVRGVYFAELADAVMREAAKVGLTVFIQQTNDERARELKVLDGSYRSLVDGVIFSPLALGQQDAGLFDVDFPLVLLGERIFDAGVDHVTMQNVEAARAAVEHVIARGAKSIVPLGAKDDPSASSGTLRMQGFRQALDAHGLDVDPRAVIGVRDYFHSTGAATMAQILDRGVVPDAVVAFADTLALGALAALTDRGLRVPEDVRLVGFDNIEETAYSLPPLTTIDPGRDEIAAQAVALLEERIRLRLDGVAREHQPAPRKVVVDFRLIERQSTR